MRLMDLIILSYFMHGLNSTREFATKNYYFPMHILFTTIYLSHEQELNPRIYSKPEINYEYFCISY
jgi:hypothetical protein